MVPLWTRAQRLLNVYTSWEHLNMNPSVLAFEMTPGLWCEKTTRGFCLRGEIRVNKCAASPSHPQKLVRMRREAQPRSHPGSGCLPLWQTNPPIWMLVVSEDGAGEEDNRQHERVRVRVNIVSMCFPGKAGCVQFYVYSKKRTLTFILFASL